MKRLPLIITILMLLLVCGCSKSSAENATQISGDTDAGSAQFPSITTSPQTEVTQSITQPIESPETTERAGCILCGSRALDSPYTEDGICQNCYGSLQETPCGFCVDCGATVKDPCIFDPYHCTGCADASGILCSQCGQFLQPAESICRMCSECYWKSGIANAHCTRCGKTLDAQSDAPTLCISCWNYMKYGMLSNCEDCGIWCFSWEMYHYRCFTCNGAPCKLGGEDTTVCRSCGTKLYDDQNYDGYCYYCSPNFGFECVKCGRLVPSHPTTSLLCCDCEQEEPEILFYCSQCGVGCELGGVGWLVLQLLRCADFLLQQMWCSRKPFTDRMWTMRCLLG